MIRTTSRDVQERPRPVLSMTTEDLDAEIEALTEEAQRMRFRHEDEMLAVNDDDELVEVAWRHRAEINRMQARLRQLQVERTQRYLASYGVAA